MIYKIKGGFYEEKYKRVVFLNRNRQQNTMKKGNMESHYYLMWVSSHEDTSLLQNISNIT